MTHRLDDESARSREFVAVEGRFELSLPVKATARLERMTQSVSELFLVPEGDIYFLGSKIPALARLGLTLGIRN